MVSLVVSLVVSGTEVVGAIMTTVVGGGWVGEVGGGGVEVAEDDVAGGVMVGVVGAEGEVEGVGVVGGGGEEVQGTVVASVDIMEGVAVVTTVVTPVATVV